MKQLESSASWFDKRTLFERYSVISFFLIIVLTILILTGMVCVYGDKCSSTAKKEKHYILKQLNEEVKPCEDFYDYTCGNHVKETLFYNRIPYINDVYTNDIQVIKKLKSHLQQVNKENATFLEKLGKTFYESCRKADNQTNDGAIRSLLQYFGDWPILSGNNWNDTNFEWIDLIGKFREKGFTIDILVSANVVPDSNNPDRYILQLGKPSIFSTDWALSFLSKEENYLKLMLDIAASFGANRTIVEEDFQEILDFEKELSEINSTDIVDTMLVSELQKHTTVNWLKLIKKVLPFDVPFTENHTISVASLAYVRTIEKTIKSYSKRVLCNYLIWRVVLEKINFLPVNIQKYYFEAFEIKNYMATESSIKEERCIVNTYQSLPHIINLINTNKANETEVENMAKRIKTFILLPLYRVDEVAFSRIKTTNFTLAKPNETVLIRYYKNLKLEEEDHLGNSLKAYKHLLDNHYRILNEDDKDWAKEENVIKKPVNYVSSRNLIELSGTVLQKPHYYKHDKNSMNFGSLGTFISQEIINQLNLEEKLQNFTNRILKIEHAYKNGSAEVHNYILNNKIIGSNGIKMAYSAYNSWLNYHKDETFPDFTPHRLFWVSAILNWCYNQEIWKHNDFIKKDFQLEFNSAFGC